ncbi:MAG: 3'(2'),5'-bisphosphate nucleotidase CysQ [Gammaproteobacteria bacterium]
MLDLATLLPEVVAIAHAAGRRILEIYATDFTVTDKADASPLTAADLAAHHTIVDGLTRLTPNVPVLSEESASIPYAERARWQDYWLIDPLDGTREFIKRNGEFTVNIALIHEQAPVLGVVQVPVSGLCYFARAGGGAFRQMPHSPAEPVHVKRLGPGPVVVAGSRSHRGESLDRFLERLGPHEIISMGSALKSCLVAEGKADIYPRLGPTSEWDTAAAHCVVVEAGGALTDTQLQPLRYNTKESLLNPHFLVFGDTGHDWAQYL